MPTATGTPSTWSSATPCEKNETIIIDAATDGRPEQQIAFTVGPPPVRITTQDTDLDGTVDRRETATYDTDAGTVHVVVEADPENDGSFVTTSDTTAPIARDAGGAKCDGSQGFPIAPSVGSSLHFGTAGDICPVQLGRQRRTVHEGARPAHREGGRLRPRPWLQVPREHE